MAALKFPFAAADVIAGTNAATNAISIKNAGLTLVQIPQLAQATTVNLTIASPMETGAMLVINWLSDGTARSLTPGTGFETTGAITGVISKTKSATFMWNGSKFQHISTGLDF